MNIFVLHKDPEIAAQMHRDGHVIKMILESVQMLSTACRLCGIDVGYKMAHLYHPCCVWARQSLSNWRWLRRLALALNEEYRYRFDKSEDHGSIAVLRKLPEPPLPNIGLTKHAQAMPRKYRHWHTVHAYRLYYVGEKMTKSTWRKRGWPHWVRRIRRTLERMAQ